MGASKKTWIVEGEAGWEDHRAKLRIIEAKYRKTIRGRAGSIQRSAKCRSKKRGIPFSLSVEWIMERLEAGVCELTGIEFDLNPDIVFYAPSVDRIVPALGYVESNCRLVLRAVNMFKCDGTDEDMQKVIRVMS